MSALTDARSRLAAGFYNSNPKSDANPGGLASGGHQLNFPAALIDLGLVLIQAGVDAQTLTTALPSIAAAVTAVADAQAARDAAIAAKNQAVEVVGVDISNKANLASPAFTGNPTAPTQVVTDSSNRLATTSCVDAKIAKVVGAAPEALDAVYELAAAINNDPNFAATMATALFGKFDKTGGTLTGGLAFSAGAEVDLGWSIGSGRSLFFGGSPTGLGAYDTASGGGMVWLYNAATKILDLRAGSTLNGATIWTTSNLSPVDLGTAQQVNGQKAFLCSNSAIASPSASAGLQVQGVGGGAFMNFYRPSAYAVLFGLDTDNQLKLGGGSAGAVANRIWTEANDGAGSGMDSDYLRGSAPDVAGTANTIVKRNTDGGVDAPVVRNGGGNLAFQYGTSTKLTVTNIGADVAGNLGVSGVATVASWTATGSDVRLKTDIAPLDDSGAFIDALKVKAFTKAGLRMAGVLAQEAKADPLTSHIVVTSDQTMEGDPEPLLMVVEHAVLWNLVDQVQRLRGRLAELEAGR